MIIAFQLIAVKLDLHGQDHELLINPTHIQEIDALLGGFLYQSYGIMD
jgi:hypothetical protein